MTDRLAAIAAAAALCVVVAPWLGAPLQGEAASFILWELRWPRVVLGVVVGAALGLVGAAFQVVLENPLATPSTVGTTAGASLGALAVLVLIGPGHGLVATGAFVGAVTVSLGIAGLAARPGLRTEDLLLAGIALTLAAGAATTGLQIQADAQATLASVRWALGSLSTVGHDKTLRLLPLLLLGGGGVLWHLRALQAMVAGGERATTQGVDVVRVRATVLATGSLAIAACVATTGPIGFVGLIVPHLVRRVIGGGPRVILPMSALAGAGFLPLADGLARMLLPGRDLPVGVLTAAMGAPALIALLLRRRA